MADRGTVFARKMLDPARAYHAYGGVEHVSEGPIEGCLICRLEQVAEAWFGWDQQALDALLHDYRKDDEDA
ncbi:MAG TPA: hypothetical protein VFY10_11560 [Dehalococcoidia bacterium]|nr:hypothetical protein [Dehalococcoidia bacterium]